jgi:aminopeptidase-like protein
VWGSFPEYHTSADNLDFIRPSSLNGSLQACLEIVDVLENNRRYLNQIPYCEPQLGRRGLYSSTGGAAAGDETLAKLWVLNLSDGDNSLLDIADRSGLPFPTINAGAELLHQNGLLSVVPDRADAGASLTAKTARGK